MQSPDQKRDLIHFGPFEVDLREGVLRKRGVRIKLQDQSFRVLTALLENPGVIVTRDELRRRLWPDGAYVDFEHGLNAAVARLRQALGDSAERQRYIARVAKRGYSFTAEVKRDAGEIEIEASRSRVAASKQRIWLWVMTAALAAGGALGLVYVSKRATPAVRYPVPLTSFRGHELHPALSPDGSRVAFTWNGEKQDNFDIYLMSIGSDAPFRLTFDPAADISPAWSPDGRTIAFLRRSGGERGELLVVSTSGGPEHRIRQIRNPELRMSIGRLASVAWSPDGRWIAASHREPEDSSQRIYLFSHTGEMRPLTSIAGIYGDQTPAFSRNGRALAFSRLPGFSTSEIYVLPLDANCNSAGEPRLVTKDERWSVNPAWLPGGHRILYLAAKHPEASHELVLTSITSGRRSRQSVPLKGDAVEIAVGRDLVYSQLRQDTNIWRAKIPDAGEAPSLGEVFISSTRDDQKPKYSPDGKRIAFVSSRSGAPEIWVSKGDGTNPVRITNFGGPLVGYMSWSPDGQHLVFHARPDGQADLFVVPAVGGAIKRLTANPADDTMPSYSRDGRWIYFTSARSRGTQIWKMPEAGGEAVQLTTSGGYRPLESADGKTVFYYAPDNSGIRSVPAGGGPPANVVGPTHDYPSGFAVTAEGIYYPSPPHSGEERFIRFFSFSKAESTPVVIARRPFDFGMTVSPDSRYILFDQYDESGSDLMLIENFRPQ